MRAKPFLNRSIASKSEILWRARVGGLETAIVRHVFLQEEVVTTDALLEILSKSETDGSGNEVGREIPFLNAYSVFRGAPQRREYGSVMMSE